MPRFFISPDDCKTNQIEIIGENARHIGRVLRMAPGDEVILCDGQGKDYRCHLTTFEKDRIFAEVEEIIPTVTEPTLKVTLFMALPKGDKMELIIQKTTELGVFAIVPVASANCVTKLSPERAEKKQDRLQQIALEAAKQSGRGQVPLIESVHTFAQAVERMQNEYDKAFLLYEAAGKTAEQTMASEMNSSNKTIAFFVGPEGGLAEKEVALCKEKGITIVGLGPRILRCETAPLVFLSILMYLSGNI